MPWRALVGLLLVVGLAAACTGDEDETPTSTVTSTATATEEPSVTATATVSPDGDRVVLEWTRAGGIAGFCDGMQVTAGHRASLGTCEDPRSEVTGQVLPIDWIGRIEGWRDRVASFELREANAPGTADGMAVTLRFEGRGSSEASEAEQQEIASFAAELFVALRAVQPRVRVR